MTLVIVPNDLQDALNRALGSALAGCPDVMCRDLEEIEAICSALYDQLLAHYDEHGEIPDFTITQCPR